MGTSMTESIKFFPKNELLEIAKAIGIKISAKTNVEIVEVMSVILIESTVLVVDKMLNIFLTSS